MGKNEYKKKALAWRELFKEAQEKKEKKKKKSNSFPIKPKHLQDLDRYSNEPYTISLPFYILFPPSIFFFPFDPEKKTIISISSFWSFSFLICAICPFFFSFFFFPIFIYKNFFLQLDWRKKFSHDWFPFKKETFKNKFQKNGGVYNRRDGFARLG